MNKDKKTKRIGIDARFYGPLGKGLGRYTQEIVDNIVRLDQANEYVIFLRQENFFAFKSDNLKVKKVLADIKWYGWAEQLIFPLYIWRERLNLMHFTHFNVPIFCPVKFIVTVHDLILIKFPTSRATTLGPLVYKMKNLAYKAVISLAVKRARKILTVSEYTKNEIVRQFKVEPQKIIVAYEGVAKLQMMASNLTGNVISTSAGEEKSLKDEGRKFKGFLPLDKLGVEMTEKIKPYLLYVGNAYPHKNLEGLIKVFSEINKNLPDLRLILVGKEDYFYNRLKQYAKNFSRNVIFPGYVPDRRLAEFYHNALVYVFPSFYEGFGLPPLEAMAHGLAVASSNKTCLPEILGQAALYFNPDDEADMKHKIERALTDEKLRAELISRGYVQAKKYSWRDCAEKTLEVYKKILK